VPFEIGGRRIGRAHPVFVIAEIGLNHGGDVGRALELVDRAAEAGASAVKLQTLDAAQLVAEHCPAPAHVSAESLRDFFRGFELDLDAHQAIVHRARRHGLAVLSTPLCESAVMMLEALGLDAYKIASGDLTHDGLIAAVSRTGRPVVISTGMSELHEVTRALWTAWDAGARDVALLHCVSAYPVPPDQQNLRAIATLAEAAGVPAGLSDHGPGLLSAVTAVALGACIYERHLVLEDDADAVDRAVSSTPAELRAIVEALAQTHAALGDGVKRCQPAEAPNVIPSRRGLYATRPLRAGDTVERSDIAVLRPAAALSPADLEWIIGATLTRDVALGTPLVHADVGLPQLV
jgi:N,N'-diacetyllegionaminate synthase